MELKAVQQKKELEEDKKIPEFAFKKQQLEDIKKKVLEAKEVEKQKQRDKLEKIQLEYFKNMRQNENEIY